MLKNLFGKVAVYKEKLLGTGAVLVTSANTSAITYSGGKVTFGPEDTAVVDTAIDNGVSNLWAGATFTMPYIGTFLGVALVFGIIMYMIFRRR